MTAKYIDRTFRYPHAPFAEYDHEPARPIDGLRGNGSGDLGRQSEWTRSTRRPEFPGEMMRFVPENAPGYRYVDDPVTAKDTDPLVYTRWAATTEPLFYIAGNDVTVDDDGTTEP